MCELDEGPKGQAEEGRAAGGQSVYGGVNSAENVHDASRPPRVFGCELGVVCFNAAPPSLVKTFVLQLLNEDSNIKGSEKGFSVHPTYF